MAEPKDPAEVLAQFPNLRSDAFERLGDIQFPQAIETPEPAPEAEPDFLPQRNDDAEPDIDPLAGDDLRAADAVEIEGDAESADVEQPDRAVRALKTGGYVLTGIGLVADAAAVTFLIWGDQILPSWAPASDPDILTVVAASGGVLIISGILFLLLGIQMSQ